VLAVPLEIASGVRMKILEAWARGVPVVATTAAARGLEAEPGRELLVAESAADFAAALRQLGERPALRRALVDAGRDLLRREHAFDLVARRLGRLYASLAAAPTTAGSPAPGAPAAGAPASGGSS
jgi:glycosyltransferase involved in cell wall biosynthesis